MIARYKDETTVVNTDTAGTGESALCAAIVRTPMEWNGSSSIVVVVFIYSVDLIVRNFGAIFETRLTSRNDQCQRAIVESQPIIYSDCNRTPIRIVVLSMIRLSIFLNVDVCNLVYWFACYGPIIPNWMTEFHRSTSSVQHNAGSRTILHRVHCTAHCILRRRQHHKQPAVSYIQAMTIDSTLESFCMAYTRLADTWTGRD